MTVYHSFEDWAQKVPPAPRCSECDKPLALGEVANRPNDGAGVTDWLCVRCAVHLEDPNQVWLWRFGRGWMNTRSECGFVGGDRAWLLGEWAMKTGPESEATCSRCKRGRESRLYLESFRS